MYLYRAISPRNTYWSSSLDDAMATAQDWAVAMSRNKVTGEVEVSHMYMGVRNPQKLVEILNGHVPFKRRWYVRFENGVPLEEYKKLARNPRVKSMPVFTTVHPSPKHADWVKTMMRDVAGYQDIFKRAPDARTALVALKLAKADRSSGGHRLTLDIAEYLWQWANCSLPKRKRRR